MGCPRGLVLGGGQSRVGAGTGFACRTGQQARGQLVLVGRAESSEGRSSPGGGGVQPRWWPQVPRERPLP